MRREGSITVFAALSLMLIASFLFALLEAGRVYGLSAYAEKKTQLGAESVCAEYQPCLYEEYRLLGLDGAYGGEEFAVENVEDALCRRIRQNMISEGVNFFRMEPEKAEVEAYQLLTDANGRAFIYLVSSYMKEKLAGDVLEALLAHYQQNGEVARDTQAQDGVENADAAIAEAKKAQAEAESEKQENAVDTENTGMEKESEEQTPEDIRTEPEGQAPEEEQENLLDIVLELKRNAVLGMVLSESDRAQVSSQTVDFSDSVTERKRIEGNWNTQPNTSFLDKCLTVEYLGQYFSDYRNPKEGRLLSYELEYVLCGKDSDADNLESAVNRLLLLRQSANFIHIVQDSAKWKEALAVATALAGFSGNPVVIKVVQVGIAAAWAFIESILDVRALLRGKKISLIKDRSQWTTDIGNLMQAFSSGGTANNCSNGITYQQYLKGLIALENTAKLAYRSMGIMEYNLRAAGFSGCRLDHLICRLTFRVTYRAESQFGRLSVIGNEKTDGYSFQKTKSFSYQP